VLNFVVGPEMDGHAAAGHRFRHRNLFKRNVAAQSRHIDAQFPGGISGGEPTHLPSMMAIDKAKCQEFCLRSGFGSYQDATQLMLSRWGAAKSAVRVQQKDSGLIEFQPLVTSLRTPWAGR
jgi:hypothetical protein